MRRAPVLALSLVGLLLASGASFGQTGNTSTGQVVTFPIHKFNDTLFAGVTVAYRASFDADGDIWYSTPSGVVHLALAKDQRELFTKMEGLPSSLALGLAISGNTVYAGTDLGLVTINRTSGATTNYTTLNSDLSDDIVREVVVDGANVWMGTHFGGVTIWNTTTNVWSIKNTSTTIDFAKPVKRIVPTPTAVWVGTDGDGVWKFDRATQTWSVLIMSDGLPSNTVLSIIENGNNVYFGTENGLARWAPYAPFLGTNDEWRIYNTTNSGMPDNRGFDLDMIPTVDGGSDLFVSTRNGLWQLDPESGNNATLGQRFGILGSNIYDTTWDADLGWIFATTRGISLLRGNGWDYYSTGASIGASSGPETFRFTAAATSPDNPYVWMGSDDGLYAFEPAHDGKNGRWYNLAEWFDYPGGPINHIAISGNTTWLATNTGVVGFDAQASEWKTRTLDSSRNLIYGLDAAQGELWIGAFGDGLIMENLTTGVSRAWTTLSVPEPIPDAYITDVRIAGDEVWLGSSVGVIRMDRLSGTFKGTYTTSDGIPGSAVVFRTLPDGPVVWVGTRDGGVARLDIATGKVNRVWNATNTPGFPNEEVRDLYREGGRLWAATKGGIVRIDVAAGTTKTYNQTNSGLVQTIVGGITARDGILYAATGSGTARLDISTDTWLPMRDGPDVQRGTGTGIASTYRVPINLRFETPRDGSGVTGIVNIKGAANRLGGSIDRVEIRLGAGPWQDAAGTDSWNFRWDTAGATPNEPMTITARAYSGGEVSREVDILVTPVALPNEPLMIDHTQVHSATAGRALLVGAKISGDEPLAGSLFYRIPGRDVYARVEMTRAANVFSATIPAKDVQIGNLSYYIVGRSGILEATTPEDPSRDAYDIEVGPAPRLAVDVQGPGVVTAKAGNDTKVALTVSNVGTESASYTISASGIRASWVTVTSEPITLEPGASQEIVATLRVPIAAFADNTTLTFDVSDVNGEADPAQTTVPIQILAAPPVETPVDKPTPAPTPLGSIVPIAAIAMAALALSRRWRK